MDSGISSVQVALGVSHVISVVYAMSEQVSSVQVALGDSHVISVVYAMSEQVPSVQVFPGVQDPELSKQFVSSLSYCVSEQVPAVKQVDSVVYIDVEPLRFFRFVDILLWVYS